MDKSADLTHWIIEGEANTGTQGVGNKDVIWIIGYLHIGDTYCLKHSIIPITQRAYLATDNLVDFLNFHMNGGLDGTKRNIDSGEAFRMSYH